jgi:hypothetical protein
MNMIIALKWLIVANTLAYYMEKLFTVAKNIYSTMPLSFDIDHGIQHNHIQHNDTQYSDTQNNDTQHSDAKHIDTQHHGIQHNDTQHNANSA